MTSNASLSDDIAGERHWNSIDDFRAELPKKFRWYESRAKPSKKELEIHPKMQKIWVRCAHFKPPDDKPKLRKSQHPTLKLGCLAHYFIANCNPDDPDLVWMLKGINTNHNALCLAQSQSPAHSSINAELMERRLTTIGDAQTQITWQEYLIGEKKADMKLSRTLKHIRARYNLPNLSTHDCRTVLRAAGLLKGDELENDAREFLATLQRQEKDGQLRFYNQFHLEGPLRDIVWVTPKQVLIGREHNLIWSMDATFNITRYCLNGVVIAALTNTGNWIPIVFALFETEPASSYIWLLKKTDEIFKTKPQILITDQGSGECSAIKTHWPDVHHALCAWHIGKKLRNKFAPWRLGDEITQLFWSLVKYSGDPTVAEKLFWYPFLDSLSPEMENDEEFRAKLDALTELIPRCGRPWARTFTAGILSTSGSENTFSSLKNLIGLKEISLMSFLQSAEQCLEKALYRQKENHLQQENLIEANYQALFRIQRYEELEKQLSLPAVKQLVEFNHRSENYGIRTTPEFFLCDDSETSMVVAKVSATPSDSRITVRRIVRIYWNLETKNVVNWSCTCRRHIWLGIPCHHSLCLLRHLTSMIIPEEYPYHQLRLSSEVFCEHWLASKSDLTAINNSHSPIVRNTIHEMQVGAILPTVFTDNDTNTGEEILARSEECTRFFRDIILACQLPRHFDILDQQLDVAKRLIRESSSTSLVNCRKRASPSMVKNKNDPRSKKATKKSKTSSKKKKTSSSTVSSSSLSTPSSLSSSSSTPCSLSSSASTLSSLSPSSSSSMSTQTAAPSQQTAASIAMTRPNSSLSTVGEAGRSTEEHEESYVQFIADIKPPTKFETFPCSALDTNKNPIVVACVGCRRSLTVFFRSRKNYDMFAECHDCELEFKKVQVTRKGDGRCVKLKCVRLPPDGIQKVILRLKQ
jgi:hypothetical protein